MSMTLKDLATERDDHTVGVKTYDKNIGKFYLNFPFFYMEYMHYPEDFNYCLIFKWDIVYSKGDNSYYMDILMYGQDDGTLTICKIQTVTEADVPKILQMLTPHCKKLKQLWLPISDQS
jgi:hypothetical protein